MGNFEQSVYRAIPVRYARKIWPRIVAERMKEGAVAIYYYALRVKQSVLTRNKLINKNVQLTRKRKVKNR